MSSVDPAFDSPVNRKSDVLAKAAFIEELRERRYENARIANTPADIIAEKDGHTWYFEIKTTRKTESYFGAATLTEWIQAAKDPEHFSFVIAWEEQAKWRFREFTPENFIRHSYIPPFKIYFNVSLKSEDIRNIGGKSTRVRMTLERLRQMEELYKAFKS